MMHRCECLLNNELNVIIHLRLMLGAHSPPKHTSISQGIRPMTLPTLLRTTFVAVQQIGVKCGLMEAN